MFTDEQLGTINNIRAKTLKHLYLWTAGNSEYELNANSNDERVSISKNFGQGPDRPVATIKVSIVSKSNGAEVLISATNAGDKHEDYDKLYQLFDYVNEFAKGLDKFLDGVMNE
ncbi:MAG: hypothetical protein JWO06_2421 [Bacteroidota bacterium]|nr:hypothetical protein [Bacteroidota bacterium]